MPLHRNRVASDSRIQMAGLAVRREHQGDRFRSSQWGRSLSAL